MAIHVGSHHQAEYATTLIVEHRHRNFALFEHFAEWTAEIELIVVQNSVFGQSVGLGGKLNVQSIERRFSSVVCAAPVGNYNAIKTPFSFQNLVDGGLVVTTMLAFVSVV